MRLRTTGVFAPKVKTKQTKVKNGKELILGASLKEVKQIITKGFHDRQQSMINKKPQQISKDFMLHNASRTEMREHYNTAIPTRIDNNMP